MPTTPNMGLVTPTDHGSSDVWDTILDTLFSRLDLHNHTTGLGVQVPAAGLNMNADLSFANSGTPVGITNTKTVNFAAVAAGVMTAYAGALFVNSADSELYYRTTAGTNVKVSNGAALNVAAFTGGIGGDYSAVGALELFDDATDSYWLQQQGAPRPWAGLRVGNVDIYQQAPSIATRVRLMSPGALAASYALTLFTALPAANAVVMVDASGNMTAPTSPTLANNANITLQGTGYVRRGNSIVYYVPIIASLVNGTATTTGGQPGAGQAASLTNYYPLLLSNFEERIQSVVVRSTGPGTPTGTVTATLCWADGISGFGNNVTGATNIAWTAAASTVTLTPTTPATINHPMWLKIVTAAASTVTVLEVEIHLDIP